MSGINKVILIGNLGKDPEVRYTQDGTAIANITVATSESWKDKNTGEKKEKTEWHNVVCFRKLAEICGEYLKKGSKVYIEGKLQTDKYDKDGQTHYSTKIVGNVMQMLDSRANPAGETADRGRRDPGAAPGAGSVAPDFNDDIPF